MKFLSQKIRSHGKKAVILKNSKKNIRSKHGTVNVIILDNPKGASIRSKHGTMSYISPNLIRSKKNMNVEKVIVQAFADNMTKDNALRKKKKAPIAKYDLDTQRAYLEFPDGRRVYND